ncbi:MAG: FecR domain-containing protein [Spirochaetales bacterium]|nr:FecR domain-containing protein [Spirochaetales bacterium]
MKQLVILLILTVGLAFCRKPETAEATRMVVVLATGDSYVIRGQEKIKATVGLPVQQEDQVEVGNGRLDIQTRGGNALRIRPGTKGSLREIAGEAGLKFELSKGGVLVSARKQAAQSDVQVITPTAIAGVRGTSFSVTVNNEGKNAKVRVLDGAVALSPRARTKKEIVLKGSTEGSLPAAVEQAIATNAEIPADAELTSRPATITPEERAERATLVVVSPEKFSEALQHADAGEMGMAADLLSRERQALLANVLPELRLDAEQVRFSSAAEVASYYSKVSSVVMKDGRTFSGALLSESPDMIVVHAREGLLELKRSEIQEIR